MSTYAAGFPLDEANFGCVGPIGLAFDSTGDLFVMDPTNDTLYKFPPGGGTADAVTEVGVVPQQFPVGSTNSADAIGSADGLAFGADGNLYATTTGGFEGGGGSVVQLNPSTGQIVRQVEKYNGFGTTDCALGLATDPLSGDLFFTEPHCTLLGGEPYINRISNPYGNAPTFGHYAQLGGAADGISIAPDGTIYTANEDGGIDVTTPTNGPQPATTTDLPDLQTAGGGLAPVDGVAVGVTGNSPHASFLVVNRNDGIVTLLSNLSAAAPTQTDIFSGGSRGDFVTVGPDGCIYATQTDRIIRLTQADGTCNLAQTGVRPQLGLSPTAVAGSLPQGSSQTFTATLVHTNAPAGTIVHYAVLGANSTIGLTTVNAQGQATFTLHGLHPGEDTVSATASPGGTTVDSNAVTVEWAPGPHPTALDLNLSPQGGAAASPSHLQAVLYDTSSTPPAPLPGKSVTLAVGSASCVATTDSHGLADCSITPSGGPGADTLTATFAGDANDASSTASQPFLLTDLLATSLSYSGDTTAAAQGPIALAAQLSLPAGGALAGEPITLTLGDGASAQSCAGTTDAGGVARCVIASWPSPSARCRCPPCSEATPRTPPPPRAPASPSAPPPRAPHRRSSPP